MGTQDIDRIKTLQMELARLQRQVACGQSTCQHSFSEPRQVPEEYSEEVLTGEYETHGVHHWPITRMVTKTRYVWQRTCSKCGKVEKTDKTKPVMFIPDFG